MLARALSLLLLGLLCTGGSPASAAELRADRPVLHAPALDFAELVGREYRYDISFLWFDRLARGRFLLLAGEEPGTFRAVLEARTLGVAAWLTGDRVQSYVSLMARDAGGGLRSLVHESRVIKRRDGRLIERTKRFVFDHDRRQVRVEKVADGRVAWQETLPMEGPAPPCDILTAYFNFRAGRYGPLEPGRRYRVPAFSREGRDDIEIELLAGERRREMEPVPPGGLVARVRVDPEIFDSEAGGIYVWFDDRLRPVRGVVENVIGLGDVRGTLSD